MYFHHYAVPYEKVYRPEVNFLPYPGRILGDFESKGLT